MESRESQNALNINAGFIALSHQYSSQCDWGHGDLPLMKLATDSFPYLGETLSIFLHYTPYILYIYTLFYVKIIIQIKLWTKSVPITLIDE